MAGYTNEEHVRALRDELRGCVARGEGERAKLIVEQIELHGGKATPAASARRAAKESRPRKGEQRATTRP